METKLPIIKIIYPDGTEIVYSNIIHLDVSIPYSTYVDENGVLVGLTSDSGYNVSFFARKKERIDGKETA